MAALFSTPPLKVVYVSSSFFSADDPLSLPAICLHRFHLRLWILSSPVCDAAHPPGDRRRRPEGIRCIHLALFLGQGLTDMWQHVRWDLIRLWRNRSALKPLSIEIRTHTED